MPSLLDLKAKAMTSNTMQAIRKRNQMADRWIPRVKRDVKKELNKTVRQAAERAKAGMTDVFTDNMATDLKKRLMKAKRPLVRKMVEQGAELGKLEIGMAVEKKKGKADLVLGTSEQGILHEAREQNIEKYLEETSRIETETSRKKLDDIFRKANSYFDEELQMGYTPLEVAGEILAEGLAQSEARAELLARTTTIWSMNEGAMQSYEEAGVAVMGWAATEDDLTCFPGFTLINSPSGKKSISSLIIGDDLFNAEGIGKVEMTTAKNYTGKMVIMVCENSILYCTSDHPVWNQSIGQWIHARDFKIFDTIKLLNNQISDVLGVFNFDLKYADNSPSILDKIRGLASVAFSVLMPVCSICFNRYLFKWKRKINRIITNGNFLLKNQADRIQCVFDYFFKRGFTAISPITCNRAESTSFALSGSNPEFLCTSIAFNDNRRSAANFRTIFSNMVDSIPSLLVIFRNKLFPTSRTLFCNIFRCSTFPTTISISSRNAGRNLKHFSTIRAKFINKFLIHKIAIPTTKSSRFGIPKNLFAYFTMPFRINFYRITDLALAIAITITKKRFNLSCSKLFSTLSTFFHYHGSPLQIVLWVLYHKWSGNTTVYNLSVSGHPSYYAGDVLVHNCEICMEMDGQMVEMGDSFLPVGEELEGLTAPFDINHPPLHPHCVLDGQRLIPSGKWVSTISALYDGQAIELSFADGSDIAITTNHMLLTPYGFARADSLCEGDYVVNCSALERIIRHDPQDNNGSEMLQEIVNSPSMPLGMASISMPSSSEYLHGDGRFVQGNIDIVYSNSLLQSAGVSSFVQQRGKHPFGVTYSDLVHFLRQSDFVSMFKGLAFIADGIMSGVREPSFFFSGRLTHSQKHGFASVPLDYSDRVKPSDNRGTHYSELLRKCLNGLSGIISLDKIVHVNSFHYKGKVFDGETTTSLYTCNGILSSNCRCAIVPVVSPEVSEALIL